MTYATQQHMADRFGEDELLTLTDRATPPTGAIDPLVVARALDDASSDIDAYIGGRYTLPLTTVPRVLERVACDIARYYLYDDRATEPVKDRRAEACAFLRDVGQGRASLDLDPASAPAAGGTGPASAGPERVFTAETLDDFR